jgi:hypothetical protein
MYFGLIKTTSSWYHGQAALRQFSTYSLVTLTIWIFFLFLHYRPLLTWRAPPNGYGQVCDSLFGNDSCVFVAGTNHRDGLVSLEAGHKPKLG